LFWGFGLFFISYILFIGWGGVWPPEQYGKYRGWIVYASALDISGILLLSRYLAAVRVHYPPSKAESGRGAGIILVWCSP